YRRMREWRDIHQQLSQAVDDLRIQKGAQAAADYHQVHRALLAGLLHSVAEKEDANSYRMAHQRTITLFPGSTLYDRKTARAQRQRKKPARALKSTTPDWIVCGEIVETS